MQHTKKQQQILRLTFLCRSLGSPVQAEAPQQDQAAACQLHSRVTKRSQTDRLRLGLKIKRHGCGLSDRKPVRI